MTLEEEIRGFADQKKRQASVIFTGNRIISSGPFCYFIDQYTEGIIKVIHKHHPAIAEDLLLDLLLEDQSEEENSEVAE